MYWCAIDFFSSLNAPKSSYILRRPKKFQKILLMAQKLKPNDYLQGMIEGSIEVEDGSGLKYEYKVVKLENEMTPEEEAMIEQESTGYF